MIQISFEPAFDPYHTAFRFIVQSYYAANPVNTSMARIFDIFILEPFRVENIRVPNSLKKRKRLAAACQRAVYGKRPSTQSLYDQMRVIQDAALQTLVLRGVYEIESYERDTLALQTIELSETLRNAILLETERLEPVLSFLYHDVASFGFDGLGGVKDRTKLGEFMYDVV